MAAASDPRQVSSGVSSRLKMEEDNLLSLRQHMTASEHLTSGMVGILGSFESRLSRLEQTILPVYQETDNLQRRQENIDATLQALDHVISFHNVAKEVEQTVRDGPNGVPLETFLQTMSRLKGALDYFERNNPQSIELENVRSLYELGGDQLSRELADVVKKHSKPVPPVVLINASAVDAADGIDRSPPTTPEDLSSIHHFPEEIHANLMQISEWLLCAERDDFMNVYASVRSQVMKKSLEQLRDHHRSASSGSGNSTSAAQARASPSVQKKFSSPMAMAGSAVGEGTPTGKKVSRLQTSINRKFSTLSTKMEAATGLSVGRRSVVNLGNSEHNIAEWEVEAFCLSVSALQSLMSSEQMLMVGIIPHQFQRKIFAIVVRDSIDSVIRDGESIIARVKKILNSNSEFLSLLMVFHVIRFLMSVKPQTDRTLETCDPEVRGKYNGLMGQFVTTGALALDGFMEGIRSDTTTREKMPKDGTVFQLTSNVILFLEQLLDFVDTIASILQQDTSYNQTLLRLPRKISVGDRNLALVGLYIKKVLVQLNLVLINKSESYSDAFLKAVFRLNNNQYILRSLQRTGIMDAVLLAEPDCDQNYNDMILEQKRLYSQSWSRVLNFIWSPDDIPTAILQAPGKLSDRYCRIIKEKFAGFNKEIDDIVATQRMYSIPDVELRESLKRDNKEYILPKYNGFYEKYANIAFTKHPEKYIKYTPAQISALIDCFFDAAA